MDFQTCKLRTVFQVQGHKHCDHSYKTVKNFINSIDCGDIILIEYPLIIESRASGGPKPFSIKVTNLRTMKTLSMKSTEVRGKVLQWLEEPKEIDML